MHQDDLNYSEVHQSGSRHNLSGIPLTAQALCQQLTTESKTDASNTVYGHLVGAAIPSTVPRTVKQELPSRHIGASGGSTIHHHGPVPPRTGSSPSHTNLQLKFKMSNQQSQKTGSTGHSSSAFAAANKLLMENKPLSSTFPNLTALANQSAGGPSPKKKVKLEEKPAPNTEIANYRKLIIDGKIKEMLEIKENYIENLSELFFLQSGGNMMDFFVWKKRPTPQLVNFLKSSNIDSDDEDDHGLERKINNEVKVRTCSGSNVPIATPVAISTTLPPSVAALNQQGHEVKRPGGRHGMVFGHAPSVPAPLVSTECIITSIPHLWTTQTPIAVPLSVIQPDVVQSSLESQSSTAGTTLTTSVTMPQLQSQLTKTVTDTKPLIINTSCITKSSSSPALSSLVKSHKSPPISPRPQQISSVYDGTVGTQEAIVERAKQEAQVMQRVAELRKDGMWSSRRLPKVHEPPRCKGHWDYLLEEMQWLAADFQQERKWKKVAARKIAKMITKHFQELEQKEQKAEEEEGKKLKKIASQVAKCVREFWSNIEKVVQYKQQSRLEEKRKKALDIHLNFIVDQTEKYSTWLTEGLAKGSSVGSAAGSVGSVSEAGDDEFKPEGDESDDEETIEKEEAEMEKDEVSTQDEVAALQKESEVPLEDLLKTLPSDILERPASIPDDDEEEMEEDENKDDEEFTGKEEDDADNEDTIAEQEKREKKVDYSKELKDLENEGEMSMDELYKKYAAAYDSDFEYDAESDASDEEEDETDVDMEEDEEEEDEEEENVDVEEEDVGLESLMKKEDEIKIEDETGPGKELTDIAAEAQSLQPKGYTLETATVKTEVPFLMKHTLREYQHVGLDWLATMYEKRLNGILADEMGLGKTIQTIALLAHLACEKVIWGPHLIVVPTSVMLNWEMELKKWCPAFKILTYYGTQKERKAKRQGWTKTNAFHVCITSYKLVIQDHQAFRRKKWKYLILDEAQNIKNFKSQRWQMLLNFSSQRRLLLTGTPLQNSLMELWSLMHFLMPHVFQSHKEFKEWFANPLTGMIEGSHEYNESLIRRLHKVLRPFLLRRLKADVEKQMPKKFEHVVMCHLSKRQRYLYDDFMSQGQTKETLQSGHFMSVINVLMQLRKVCNHPSLFDPRPIISPFQAEGIHYYTSSFVLKVLEYDPFKDIDLYSLYPNLAEMETDLPAFVAHRVKQLQTDRKLIEEIDDIEDEEERPAPGKLQTTSFPNILKSGQSQTTPTTVLSSSNHQSSTVPVMTPTIATVSTPGLMTVASTTPVTSVVQTNKTFLQSAGQTVGQSPITVQIQQTDQGARLMIPAGQLSQLPAGFIQIVQTSLGQQMIATSAIGSVATTASAVVNGHQTITTTAMSSVTATTMASTVRPSVQLPTVSSASKKPVMRVSPLTTQSQATSSIINVTDLSGDAKPSIQTRQPKRKQKRETRKSEFYSNSLEEKRAREREQKLDFIARMNDKHCSRVPVYGQDLCHTVDVFRDLPQNSWKGSGMVHCHNVHNRSRHPSDYWKQTTVLSELVNTPEQFLQQMEDLILRYTFVSPPVTCPRIQMHTSHPPPHHLVEERLRETILQTELSPKATCLHPISTRLLVQFPEKRLIQYDCGKLQVLDILLHRLKTEGHRVLVFTQMTKMLNILEAFLNYHGHRYLRLDGATKVEQRQVLMDRFNADNKIFVFILSTRSGGIGVNLTGADTVIFYDSDWNPTMDAQAQDRCHRIGQTRDVHIYRLVSERTVEENILKKANQKRMLGDMAIEGGNFTTTFFKEQTIKDLFTEPSGLESLVEDNKPKEKDLKVKSLEEVAGQDDIKDSDTKVITQFEKALAKTEDETDAVAVEQVKAEQKAELAEFDENIPWDEREAERKQEEESKVEMELAMLEKELTPVERYAVGFMEEEMDPLAEELQIAEDDIENAKKEWELGRLKALKEEEERRLEVEEDEMLFTYTREDAFNQVKKSAKKAKAKTPARPTPVRKRPAKKKDENYVIDEDKRRSAQGLNDSCVETPKSVRPVGRPPKNKTPKQTPKSAKGKKTCKVDVENDIDVMDHDETPKLLKSKRQHAKNSEKITEEEKEQTAKMVSKILAQAHQKTATSIAQAHISSTAQQQITYSQQLLAQSQRAGLTKVQLASAMQKVQSPRLAKPATVNPQLLSASQLQHLKQIISSAHRNITPGQPNNLPQQFITSPVKASGSQQVYFQTSPNQLVLSQGPQIITQQQIQAVNQSLVQGRGPPALLQVQQPQNIPAFVQVGGSSMIQVPRTVQATKTVPTTQVVQFQTSPSALLAQIQASRVHVSHASSRNPTPIVHNKPTIVQAGQGTHLVIPPSRSSAQYPGYSTPSIINVQNMAQATKPPTGATQFATIQDIQLVVSNASGGSKVVGSQVLSKAAPAIQQAKIGPPQTIQVVHSQNSLAGGNIQQVITQNSAGQPVLSFVRPSTPQGTAPRPGQPGVVYLQLAGGKAIPVSLASSPMPVVKTDKAKVFLSDIDQEKMPMWTPPTPPHDDNDIYIDQSLCFLYEHNTMPETQLPPIYIKKEHKKPKIESITTRKQKQRKEEQPRVPRSLFDRPTSALLKLRREAKLKQGLLKPFRPVPQMINKPADPTPDHPEWLIHEDWALLQSVQTIFDVPLNLMVVSPAHLPNWDLVADIVNSCSRVYRSAKQCKSRYENVIIPREEGRILYDVNPKKQTKKAKGIYKTKNNRPMRTSQLFVQDNNQAISMLHSLRFDSVKGIATKRPPPLKQTLVNPTLKNPKHASVLTENEINYEQPLTPMQVAEIRAQRIQREKKQNQAAAAAASEQQLQKSQAQSTPATPAPATPSQPATAAVVVAQSIAQSAQQLQQIYTTVTTAGLQTATLAKTAVGQAVTAVSLPRANVASNIVVNTPAGVGQNFAAINRRMSQASAVQPATVAVSGMLTSAIRPQQRTATPQEAAQIAQISTGQVARTVTTPTQIAQQRLPTTVAGSTIVGQQLTVAAGKAITPQQQAQLIQQRQLQTISQQQLKMQKLNITQQQLRQLQQQNARPGVPQKTVIAQQLVTTVGQVPRQQKRQLTQEELNRLRQQQQLQKTVQGQQLTQLPATQIIAQGQVQPVGQQVTGIVKTVSTPLQLPTSSGAVSINVTVPAQKANISTKATISQLQKGALPSMQLLRKGQPIQGQKITTISQPIGGGKTQIPVNTVQIIPQPHSASSGRPLTYQLQQIMSSNKPQGMIITSQPTIIATVTQSQPSGQIVTKVLTSSQGTIPASQIQTISAAVSQGTPTSQIPVATVSMPQQIQKSVTMATVSTGGTTVQVHPVATQARVALPQASVVTQPVQQIQVTPSGSVHQPATQTIHIQSTTASGSNTGSPLTLTVTQAATNQTAPPNVTLIQQQVPAVTQQAAPTGTVTSQAAMAAAAALPPASPVTPGVVPAPQGQQSTKPSPYAMRTRNQPKQ